MEAKLYHFQNSARHIKSNSARLSAAIRVVFPPWPEAVFAEVLATHYGCRYRLKVYVLNLPLKSSKTYRHIIIGHRSGKK